MNLFEKKSSSKSVFEGKIFSVSVDDVELPNGKKSSREIVHVGKASCVLAQLPNGKFILERQYRSPYEKILLELPAGKCEKDEDHKVTAIRELEEETGFFAGTIKYLGKIYPSVGYCNEVIYLYYATDLTKTRETFDEDEAIELQEVTLDELENMILDGTIVDAKTLACILQYKLSISK